MKIYSTFLICLFFSLIGFFSVPDAENSTNFSKLPESEAELGKLLFLDNILSEDYSINCATCHKPEFAFADTIAFSLGVHGQSGTRNTPSVTNVLSRPVFFWDGRAQSLEEQALMPVSNPIEMNLNIDSAIVRLNKNQFYVASFRKIYGKEADKNLLASALAEFQRTLETSSAWDRYSKGDSAAISASAIRGIEIFNVKGKCFDCHFGPDLTGDEFRNIGLFDNKTDKDKGRYDFTKDSSDLGKFKVPTLRNVAVTAPYMHDGSFKTLREVIVYYNEPDKFKPHGINRDSLLAKPLGLTEQEMTDLESFLISLTAPQYLPLLKKK
jgi:cytochrome c peroxidase